MTSSWRLLLACLAVVACQAGCDNQKVDSLRHELDQRQSIIQSLETQNARIAQRCQQLESEVADLRVEQDNLTAQNEELAQWSRRLAQRFGPSVWYFGEGEKPLPVKSYDHAKPTTLLAELNRRFGQSKLPRADLIKIEGTVAYMRIVPDLQLTQTMGTTGATSYLQAVTYTLTSLPGIDAVDFDFEPGDHAMPGRYSR
jgi:hypothetical protein